MAHAELCPICNGTGKKKTDSTEGSTYQPAGEETCHGCFGLGWVVVGVEPPVTIPNPYPTYPIYPTYPQWYPWTITWSGTTTCKTKEETCNRDKTLR